MATQDLGVLRFSADSFSTNGGTISATGTIDIGLVPTGGEAFRPLLKVDGSVSFVDTTTDSTFTITSASLSSVASGTSLPLLASTTRDFAVSDLVGNGASLSTGQQFPVASLSFTPNLLKLVNPGGGSTSDSAVDLQGDLSITNLVGLDLPVAGSIFVTLDDTGVHLSGVSIADGQFDAFGLTIKTTGFAVSLSSSNGVSTFSFTGSVSVDDDDVMFTGSLGSVSSPGLVVANGVVQSLDIGVSGSIQVADLTVNASGLSYSYDEATQLYEITGSASLSVSGTTITADLGTSDEPGLTFQGG